MSMSIFLSAATAEIPNWFVVCMGVGTVFAGLVCIIIICKTVGLFCRAGSKQKKAEASSAGAASTPIENRQEIIAAVTAAAAESMGKDVSALRVVSFKKV